MVGKRFGRLVVLSKAQKTSSGPITWLCECDCGKREERETAIVRGNDPMKLSRQTEVAIDALVYMGRRGEQVTAQEVEAALGRRGDMWSALRALSLAGIVASKVGRNGGFVLARPLEEVTLLDVLTAIEGPVFPVARDGTKPSELASALLFDLMSRQKITLARLIKASEAA